MKRLTHQERMARIKYPLTDKERQGCTIEIARMKALRNYYAETIKARSEAQRDIAEAVRVELLSKNKEGY